MMRWKDGHIENPTEKSEPIIEPFLSVSLLIAYWPLIDQIPVTPLFHSLIHRMLRACTLM